MTLTLVRLDPDPALSARWFAAERLAVGNGDDGGYAWHALLTAAFGSAAPSPFRVVDRRGRPPQLLAYTTVGADALQDAAALADPLVSAALGLDARPLQGKAMPPLAVGRTLGFSLRVRPTVRTDRDGDRTRTAEVDAYVAALRAAPEAPPDRKAVYADWVTRKLAGGTAVRDLRLDGIDRCPVVRRDAGRRLRAVEGYAATFTGVLQVTDADAFSALLSRGVGRHRAFGYGMLLLSPA